MTPRPLYRWKTFWFSLLILAFLGWAWVRSMDFNESLSWSTIAHKEVSCGQVGGSAYFYRVEASWISQTGFNGRSDPADASLLSEGWVPSAFIWRSESGHHEIRGLHIAHWLLTLLFLIPWAGFILWRIRSPKSLNIKN